MRLQRAGRLFPFCLPGTFSMSTGHRPRNTLLTMPAARYRKSVDSFAATGEALLVKLCSYKF